MTTIPKGEKRVGRGKGKTQNMCSKTKQWGSFKKNTTQCEMFPVNMHVYRCTVCMRIHVHIQCTCTQSSVNILLHVNVEGNNITS